MLRDTGIRAICIAFLVSVFALVAGPSGCSKDSNLERVDRTEGDERIIGTLKDGEKHGRWTKLLDGKLYRITHWRDGKRHGPSFSWLDDEGPMTSDCMYVNDKLHGRYRIFYTPDQLAELGWLHKGRRERTWCSWNPDGSLEYIRLYQQDKLIREDLDPPGQCPVIFGEDRRHTDPEDKDFR